MRPVTPLGALPITDDEFSSLMSALPSMGHERAMAVAVSGGADSMALLWLLSHWAAGRGIKILALSVDHGLRPGSREEALQVAQWVKTWPGVAHTLLSWEGEKPQTRIMEEARAARYALLLDFLKNKPVRFLFTAHHLDDQAETFLIRLCKGSGLDGLAGMRGVSLPQRGAAVSILRPLLSVEKERLIATCRHNAIPYVDDPSNLSARFLRPRLRGVRSVLDKEGLSNKRLALTSARLNRAREALDFYAVRAFTQSVTERSETSIILNGALLQQEPEEVFLRVLLLCLKELGGEDGYGPRFEKVENLSRRLYLTQTRTRATLGGCLFTYTPKNSILKVEREGAS